MKQMTLRGVPVEIERMIKREAESKGLSLNKAFISLLGKITGTKEIVAEERSSCTTTWIIFAESGQKERQKSS